MNLEQLTLEFKKNRKTLIALGDENRQYLIIKMLEIGDCNGVRVGLLTNKTNLSRASVSHHLRVLKDAGLINVRRVGTKNYYYFDPNQNTINNLLEMINLAKLIMQSHQMLEKGE